MKRRSDPKTVRQIVAFLLTIAAALVALLFPVYSRARIADDGQQEVFSSTLFEVVGPYLWAPVLMPIALTGLPLVLRGRARNYVSLVTTVGLAIFVILASATIGWFYVPALVAAVSSVLASGRKPFNTTAQPAGDGRPVT